MLAQEPQARQPPVPPCERVAKSQVYTTQQAGLTISEDEKDVAAILSSPTWRAGTSSISSSAGSIPADAWHKPVSRHLKLASLAGLYGEGGEYNSGLGDSEGKEKDENECKGVDAEDQSSKNRQAYCCIHPLHVAASQGILKVGSVLFAAHAVDADVRDGFGRAPLHWAAMTDRPDFVRLLLQNGARVDALSTSRETPLFACAAFGASAAAQLLLQWGADKDASCRRGLTPLHAAAAGGYVSTAEVLIAAGADSRKCTKLGANPRHVAERQGHRGMVRLLLLAPPPSANESSESGLGEIHRRKALFEAQHRLERSSLLYRDAHPRHRRRLL